jgi:ParB family transcriptional regulator, chromosome partitioning protein
MVKKRGLGKSLESLLAYANTDNIDFADTLESDQAVMVEDTLSHIPLDQIKRGKYQPRREIDPEALQDLANSIRSQGVIQPIVVRPISDDQYEIIAGERRWRAAGMAGLMDIPAIVRDIPDEAAIAIALIENIQRENLNPIEEAIALQRLINEFGLTHQQVADAVAKSRVTVTNLLRLLNLPDEIKSLLEKGQLEMGHARTLITLPEAMQIEVAKAMVTKGLSVREAEHLVRQLHKEPDGKSQPSPVDPDIKRLQDNLSKRLKLKVAIQCNAKGKGKLVIRYKNLNQLDELLNKLQTIN